MVTAKEMAMEMAMNTEIVVPSTKNVHHDEKAYGYRMRTNTLVFHRSIKPCGGWDGTKHSTSVVTVMEMVMAQTGFPMHLQALHSSRHRYL